MDRKGQPSTMSKDSDVQSRSDSTSLRGYVRQPKSIGREEQRQTRTTYTDNPLFSRFWRTANVAETWIRHHRDYVHNLMGTTSSRPTPNQFIPPPPPLPPFPPILFTGALFKRSSKKSKKRKLCDMEEAASPNTVELSEQWQGVVSVSSKIPTNPMEGDGNMELSEDVIAFMAQTIRHRIEREKKKAYEQEIQDKTVVYVPADRPFMASRFNEFGGNASAVAEMLRQGDDGKLTAAERKQQEMIRLYGIEAAGRIQTEETLLQMKFDQEYDKHHPPFWPNIPLKL